MTLNQEECLLEYLKRPSQVFSIFTENIKKELNTAYNEEIYKQFNTRSKELNISHPQSNRVYNEEQKRTIIQLIDDIAGYDVYLKDNYKNDRVHHQNILDEIVAVKKAIEMIGVSDNGYNFFRHCMQQTTKDYISQEKEKLEKKVAKCAKIRDYDSSLGRDLPNEKSELLRSFRMKPDECYSYLQKLPDELQKQHWKQSVIEQVIAEVDKLTPILGPRNDNNNPVPFNEAAKAQVIESLEVINRLTESDGFPALNNLEPYSDDLEAAKKEYKHVFDPKKDEDIVSVRIVQLKNTIELSARLIESIDLQKENNKEGTLSFSDIVHNRRKKITEASEDFEESQGFEKIREQQNVIMEDIQSYASISSAFSRNEQNSWDVKKSLLDICEEYEALTLADKDFSAVLALVRSYGNMDATASKLFADEVKAIRSIQSALESYMEKIEKDNQKLLTEQDTAYKKLLKIKNEEERKEALKELNKQFDKRDADLDTRRHLAISLSNYFENMARGDLECPDFERIIEAEKKQKPESGYTCKLDDPQCYYINGVGAEVDLKSTQVDVSDLYGDDGKIDEAAFYQKQNELSKQKTETEYCKDMPIFPHEPRPNDISQGNLGDCYLLSGLSGVAAFRPQHIKDMIKDNGDGTATVRFYKQLKQEDGNLTDVPVYVRVDKAVGRKDGSFRGAENCLWASIIERAYAISGLHLNKFAFSNDEDVDYKLDCADKEKLDAKYEELKQEFDNIETEEEQQNYLMGVSSQYPWLIRKKQIVKDQKLEMKYELAKWVPSMESIEGGRTHMAMQTCFGLNYTGKVLDVKSLDRGISYYIKTTLRDGGMVFASTDDDKSAGIDNHAFTIIGWYETQDNPSVTMIRLRNPWGSSAYNALEFDDADQVRIVHKDEGIFDLTLDQFSKHFSHFYSNISDNLKNTPCLKQSRYNDDVEEIQNPEDGILTQDAYVEYLRFARDIHEALVKTDAWYSRNSNQYDELLKESITFRECVAKSRNLEIASLKNAYNALKDKASAYVDHLNRDSMSKRQQRRLGICKTIDNLERQLDAGSKQPRLEIQKQFLQQLITKTYAEKNGDPARISPALANKMLDKKVVRAALDKVNINELNHAKDTMIISVKEDIRKIGKGVDKEAGFDFEKNIGL